MNAEQLLQHFERISEAPDAIKRLRRFILDLAVRGKLVPQDSRDEPAAELLKRIAAEKARLVKAGEIKAVKPYERRDSSNLKLPDGWLMVSLAEIVNRHLGGGTPSKSNLKYWDGPLLWASVKDVGKSKYLTTTIDRITVEGLENSSSNLITPGNLLVVTRMGLGKVSINTVPVAINQDLRALFMSSLMDIDYCYNLLLTHGFEGSGLTVKGIKIEELLNISFPLPPLAEQHRIVARVDDLMSLCDQLEAAKAEREKSRDSLVAASLERLNQPAENKETFREHANFAFNKLPLITTQAAHIKLLRQTIIKLAMRGKLLQQDPNDEPASKFVSLLQMVRKASFDTEVIRARREGIRPPKKPRNGFVPKIAEDEQGIPCTWCVTRVGDVSDCLDYLRVPVNKDERLAASGTVPYFGANGRVGWIDKHLFDEDLVLVVEDETFIGRTKPFSYVIRGKSWVNNHAHVLRPLGGITVDFLNLILCHYPFIPLTSGTTNRRKLTQPSLMDAEIPLPPLPEQQRIVAKVDELMAICDQLEAQITATEQDSRRFLESVLADALAPGIECNHH